MLRFSLTQLLMGTALLAILLLFTQTGGCGKPYAIIECLSFSADGSKILVSKLNARDTEVSGQGSLENLSRTVSWVDAKTGGRLNIVRQDLATEEDALPNGYSWAGPISVINHPVSDEVLTTNFGQQGLTSYHDQEMRKIHISHPASYLPAGTAIYHPIYKVAISPSGRLLAAKGEDSLSILDTSNDSIIFKIQTNAFPNLWSSMMSFTKDETKLITTAVDGLHIWDIETGQKEADILTREQVSAFALLPEDTLLVCTDHWVKRYDLRGYSIAALSQSGECTACSVSPTGEQASIVDRSEVGIYDLATNKRTLTIPVRSEYYLSAAVFSPDGQTVAVGDEQGLVYLYDSHTGKAIWSSDPAGLERWSWVLPVGFLVVWIVAAIEIIKRRWKKTKVLTYPTAE